MSQLKYLQIFCASLWCLLSAGIIFGFAAFKIILIAENVYSDVCPQLSIDIANNNNYIVRCPEQDMKLNYMFTLGAGFTNVMALPVGYILDSRGPKFCGILGSFFLTLGSLSFIYSESWYPWFDVYLVGYIMFAIGGPFVFISCFQLANSFPKRSGSILALLTGCFDTSSALFLGYRLIYQHNDNLGIKPLPLSNFFKFYLLVPLFILLCQLTFMPHESYKSIGNVAKIVVEHLDENGNALVDDNNTTEPTENDALLNNQQVEGEHDALPHVTRSGRRKSVLETQIENKLTKESDGLFGILHDYTAWEQIKKPWWYLMFCFASIIMIRINYYIATIRSQETFLLGDLDKAIKVNNLFDVLLPLGGVFAIPFIGFILDHMKPMNTLYVIASLSISISLIGLIPGSITLHILGILLFVFFRPFYYTVVSDYCSKVFGFDTFGTVYGLLTCLSGVFNLLQSVLDDLTHNVFDLNPIPVNVLLLALTLVSSFALLGFTKYQLKHRNDYNPAILENMENSYQSL